MTQALYCHIKVQSILQLYFGLKQWYSSYSTPCTTPLSLPHFSGNTGVALRGLDSRITFRNMRCPENTAKYSLGE